MIPQDPVSLEKLAKATVGNLHHGHRVVEFEKQATLVLAALQQAFEKGRSTALQSCQPYLQHKSGCEMNGDGWGSVSVVPAGAKCTCGLAALSLSDPSTPET